MKRLVTACALFVLLIGGCFWEYQTVSRTTDTLALAVSGQTDPAVLTACFDDWQACRPLLASLVRHAELDRSTRSTAAPSRPRATTIKTRPACK